MTDNPSDLGNYVTADIHRVFLRVLAAVCVTASEVGATTPAMRDTFWERALVHTATAGYAMPR